MPHRCGIVLIALASLAQQPPGPRILRPANESVWKLPAVAVIAKGQAAMLTLDGKPVTATEVGPGAVFASLKATPGEHELAIGGHKIRFAVAPGPASWKEYRLHPPAAGCDGCHAVKDGAWALKGAALVESCSACHDLKTFPEVHSHNTQTLAECQLCHDPHGSTEKFHLRLPKAQACKQCHG